jgi:hypothetical protein
MSELSELLFPKLAPEQRATIVRASGAFALWRSCPRGTCRRAHACCGFAEAFVPDCVAPLAGCVAETRDALMALVPPGRRGAADALNRQVFGIAQRTAALMEWKLDELERRVGIGG